MQERGIKNFSTSFRKWIIVEIHHACRNPWESMNYILQVFFFADVDGLVDGNILFRILCNGLDMTFDPSQASHEEVKIVPATIMENNGNGLVLSQLKVALVVSRTSVLPCEVTMIPNLSQTSIVVNGFPSANPTGCRGIERSLFLFRNYHGLVLH